MSIPRARRQTGFTLIELLIVMAILGMLAALVGPTLIDKFSGSKRQAAAAQISMVEQALDAYRMDTGKYPKTLEGLLQNDANNQMWAGPYLRKGLPKDPWGNPYRYQAPGQHRKDFDLFSFGADNQEGGTDENADIINW